MLKTPGIDAAREQYWRFQHLREVHEPGTEDLFKEIKEHDTCRLKITPHQVENAADSP